MKEIPLTQGLVAMVDDEDYPLLSQFKWHAMVKDHTSYAMRRVRSVKGRQKPVLMHRVIMSAEPGVEIDHKDGNGLNNMRANLRPCTRHQNARNVRGWGTSKFKGVSWYPKYQKWRSVIYPDKKQILLGYFPSETEAALAYNRAAGNHFGEFARLNQLT